jgi:integrase
MRTSHYTNLLAQADKLRRHNRQGSYKTKERYYEAYKRFLHYVGEVWRLEKLRNISGRHLSGYVGFMQNKNLSASTIKTDLAAIRFWHDQIPDAKYALPSNDEFELARRKFGGVDRTWSDAEFNVMILECWKAERYDYEACIVIARYAGLRLHEVMRIDTATARAALKNRYIRVKGKGGKIREVPITGSIRIEFEKFLKLTPAGHKLFVPDGMQTHIAKTELQNFITTHRKHILSPESDRQAPLTFHGLRHTYAAEQYAELIREGYSEYDARKKVSELLGHERDDVTRIYLAGVKQPSGPGEEGGGGDV